MKRFTFFQNLYKPALLVVTLLCLQLAVVKAQTLDSKGTDFWLTFPGNNSTANASLFISGTTATSGMVTVPGIGFSTPFTVTPGAITTVTLPTSVFLNSSDIIGNNGIHVTALNEVTVYGLNQLSFTTDAYLGLPTDILGTSYINLGYRNVNVVNGTQFGIVATQNATVVTITPSVTTGIHPSGVPYPVVLNQGQTYMLRNTGADPNDLSGTIITSTAPIAVFGSHQCANIPRGFVACDHIVEQLPPTTAWGRNFVTVPLKTRLNGDTFRFMASDNATTVSVNGSVVATLNAGQYHEMLLVNASQVTSDKPILVAQYSNSTTFDGVTSDPFMMLIPPFEQFLNGYTIATPATGFILNFINVVAPTAAVGSITLDGVPIPAASFSPIGSSGFSGAQLNISLGTHNLGGSSQPFGVFVYGFNSADSYGYPGGQSLSPVATVNSITLTPETGSNSQGSSQCFDALVKDQFNNPVAGVRVDFNITGANPQTPSVFTNASGIAQLCYTGTNAGVDNIVASIGALSDASVFTWTPMVSNVYYSKAMGDLHNLLTWGLNPDGSGSNPPDFGVGKTFNLANRTPNYFMSGDWSVQGNVVIPTGSILHISGYTLSVKEVTAMGRFGGTPSSNLTIINADPFPFPLKFEPGENQLNTLTINRGGTSTADMVIVVENDLEIFGVVDVQAGGPLVTDMGRKLILNSDAFGTARVAPVGGAITADVMVERYIPSRRAWRILSAPVMGTQTINAAWQEGTTNVSMNPNPFPGYGTHITGGPVFGSPANGFDQNPGAASSLKFYNSMTDTWSNQPNTNATLVNANAWMIFIRGDRGIPISTTSVPPTPTTLRSSGMLKTGDQPFGVNPTGFTAIGNPYASPVDFATLPKVNVQNSMWVWDPKLGGLNGVGGYVVVSFNGIGYDVTPTPVSPINQIIQSGQGFLVRTMSAAPGSLLFREMDKSATPATDVFRSAAHSSSMRISLRTVLADGSTELIDEVLSSQAGYFSAKIDEMDAAKPANIEENLAIVSGNQQLMIERRPFLNSDDDIHLKLWNVKEQSYAFEFKPDGLSSALTAWMVDRYLQTATPVRLDEPSTYSFSVTADPGSSHSDRFELVFSQKKPVIQSLQGTRWITLYPNPATGTSVQLQLFGLSKGQYQVQLLNQVGQVVLQKTIVHNGGSNTYTLDMRRKPSKGMYQVRVSGQGEKVTEKLLID